VADVTPICYLLLGAAVNQRRADLQHIVATQRLSDRRMYVADFKPALQIDNPDFMNLKKNLNFTNSIEF